MMVTLLHFVEAFVCLVLLFNSMSPCLSTDGINKECSGNLTKLDPHMSDYIGTVQTLVATHDTGDSYKYEVGICVNVGNSNYQDCGAMQYGIRNPNLTHCLGKITKSQVARTKDGVWIELTYTGGSTYGSHCKKANRTIRVAFLCDPSISGKGHISFLEENNQDELCYYLFSIASRAVCGYSDTLTVGDIILILMSVIFFLWLLAMALGIAYKRFIVGAKGWEQIPLLDWYKAFGNLEADGCDLVCRTRSSKLVEYKEPSFGADTDEEDDEKDDNLLPM